VPVAALPPAERHRFDVFLITKLRTYRFVHDYKFVTCGHQAGAVYIETSAASS
jgi:hypothetical protein